MKTDPPPSSPGRGYNLGGSGSGGAPLSADEIRQRRLAALGGGGATISTPAATTTTTSESHPMIDNDDDGESDLQAALALSMQQQDGREEVETRRLDFSTTISHNNENHLQPAAAAPAVLASTRTHRNGGLSVRGATATNNKQISYEAQPFDILNFHSIMWDDQVTTESDKSRWISQGIDVRRDTLDTATTTTTAQATASSTTMLDQITASHLAWGLVQHHGGPCGVLAAIQAELLRMLLFAAPNSGNENDDEPIPTSPDTLAPAQNDVNFNNEEDSSLGVINTALARSIALVLARATLTPSAVGEASQQQQTPPSAVRIVLPTSGSSTTANLTYQDLEPWHPSTTTTLSTTLTVYSIPINNNIEASTGSATAKRQKTRDESDDNDSLTRRIHRLARVVEAFLLEPEQQQRSDSANMTPPPPPRLDCFRHHGGVLLLVMSLVASRGFLKNEFDDPTGTRLTAQFGHCSQELLNLLLTGQAVSNVFDNTLNPSGGEMVCRGIQARPAIGYLSQLESMRYCEVGLYYKSPIFPIWVVGSQSHFTVLFGDPAALKESKSDLLLDECRRAFKTVEGGEENGFIATEQLGAVLTALKIDVGGDAASRIQTLAASLEVSGAGIILWDDFWKAASRLLTGATLEAVLQGGDGTASSNPIIVDSGADEPPPLIANYPANPDMFPKPAAIVATAAAAAAAAPENHIETDEEMARRLAAEWNGESNGVVGGSGMSALSTVASAAAPMEIDPVLSDEEIARKLQQQWNNEGIGGSSVAGVSGSPIPPLADLDDLPPLLQADETQAVIGEEEDSKPAATPTAGSKQYQPDFEQFGDSFLLYHYNGLRGGVLTPFRITRLSAEEAVGASIALNRGAGGSSHGSGSQDLEDVVKTKWPSCSINWLGKQPPYID